MAQTFAEKDIESSLIAMGAKGASPDSETMTMALAKKTPGVVVPGAVVGQTSGGQGIAPTDIQIQAVSGAGQAENQAFLDANKKRDDAAAAAAEASRQGSAGQAVAGYTDSSGVYHPPTTTTAPPSPGGTTAGQAYAGIDGYSANDGYDQYGNILKADMQPVDEQGIREKKLQELQVQIDAVRNYYDRVKASKIAEERAAGEGRLGTGAAIQARRGLLGSTFGTGITDNINKGTQNNINAITDTVEAQRANEIAALLGKAQERADAEIAAKEAARRSSSKEYIEYLKGADERKKQSINDSVSNFLELGTEPDAATYEQLAKALGVSVQTLKAQYAKGKRAFEAANAKESHFDTVAPGASLYKNGVLVGTAPAKPADGDPLTKDFADNTTRQWNPKTNSWDVVATGTTSATGTVGEYEYYKKQEIAAGRTPMTFDEYQTADANRKARAEKATTGGLDVPTANRVDRITSQFDGEPIVKEFNVIQNAKQSVEAFMKNPTSTNDQALIYAFAKAMDPTSSVREGEYATVQKYAQSFANQLGFDVNRLFSNDPQFLTPAARKSIVDTINTKYKVGETQYKNTADEYARRVNRITGQDDGMDYITNYAGAFDTQGSQPLSGDYATRISDAQKANYSPQEIITFLAKDPAISQKIIDAQKANYSPEEILQHLQKPGFNQSLSMDQKGSPSLSLQFESSGNPGAIGYDSTGGYSYGLFQLAHNNANTFVQQSPYAKDFQGLKFNSPEWRQKWQEVAKRDPQGFSNAQTQFITQTHTAPQIQLLQNAGLKVDRYSPALQQVIESTAVQHGANTNVVVQALKNLPPNPSEQDLIREIYRVRWSGGKQFASSTPEVRQSVYNRFFGKNGELNKALALSRQYTA